MKNSNSYTTRKLTLAIIVFLLLGGCIIFTAFNFLKNKNPSPKITTSDTITKTEPMTEAPTETTTSDEDDSTSESEVYGNATIVRGQCNGRSYPAKNDYNVLCTLTAGTRVTVLKDCPLAYDDSGDVFCALYAESTGTQVIWVSQSYVVLDED